MTQKLNKLLIRAELLNAIKILDGGQKHTPEFLNNVLTPLKTIEDKHTILDILIKEIISAPNDDRFFIQAFLLENLVPKELLEDELWKLLNQPNINDKAKANIINILKDLGNQINYERYTEYFENPDSIIDADTEKMLKSAISNPEALIDFLDFIEALPEKDKNILIDSLSQDYQGAELANLFAPVLYANPNSELCKYAIGRLGESKSALAIGPLNFILEYSKNDEIKAIAKKSLISLKLAGARIDNANKFYAQAFENSKVQDVFTSMPDGRGNIGILVSRKQNDKDSLQMFAVVLNNVVGIVDCFGFNDITENEFLRIVDKFYNSQEKICLSPPVAKLLLKNAEKLAIELFGKVSYEYICWKRIIADVQLPEEQIETILEKRLTKTDITIKDLEKIYSTSIFDKWFLFNSDHAEFLTLVDDILKLLDQDKDLAEKFNEINQLCINKKDKIWTEVTKNLLDFRLLFTAYLLDVNGFKTYSQIVNSIRYDEEVKSALLDNMLKVSIYEFFLREREKHQNTAISKNIFSKRNEANKILVDKKTLDNIINLVEKNWSF